MAEPSSPVVVPVEVVSGRSSPGVSTRSAQAVICPSRLTASMFSVTEGGSSPGSLSGPVAMPSMPPPPAVPPPAPDRTVIGSEAASVAAGIMAALVGDPTPPVSQATSSSPGSLTLPFREARAPGLEASQRLPSSLKLFSRPPRLMATPPRVATPAQGMQPLAAQPPHGQPSSGTSSLIGSASVPIGSLTGTASLTGSLTMSAGAANSGLVSPPSPGSTSLASFANASTANADPATAETIDALRSEIGDLRGELESLRSVLGDGRHQREAERSRSTATARLDKLQRRKAEAESQLREAHAEAQRLRLKLARCQREAARDGAEAPPPRANSLSPGAAGRRKREGNAAGERRRVSPEARDSKARRRPTSRSSSPRAGGGVSPPTKVTPLSSPSVQSPRETARVIHNSSSAEVLLGEELLGSFSSSSARTVRVARSVPGTGQAGQAWPSASTPPISSVRTAAPAAAGPPRSAASKGRPVVRQAQSGRDSGIEKNESDLGRSSSRHSGLLSSADEMDDMWCLALQRFPEYPDWMLVKEKPGVYRMGGKEGKKILCRISHGGLQVRVGGGWMPAIPFLERHGPSSMAVRTGDESLAASRSSLKDLESLSEVPPSMERLLVPTKCWAQKIGINTTPDIREQRRLVLPEDQPPKRRDAELRKDDARDIVGVASISAPPVVLGAPPPSAAVTVMQHPAMLPVPTVITSSAPATASALPIASMPSHGSAAATYVPVGRTWRLAYEGAPSVNGASATVVP